MESVSLKQVGARLARLRKKAGLTQSRVAESLGLSTETVSRLERGAQWMEFRTLQGLARLYGVTPSELLSVLAEGETSAHQAALLELLETLRPLPTQDVLLVRELARILFRRGPWIGRPPTHEGAG